MQDINDFILFSIYVVGSELKPTHLQQVTDRILLLTILVVL